MRSYDWMVNDSQDNAQAEAIKVALSGRTHYLTGVYAGYEQLPLDYFRLTTTANNAAATVTKAAAAGTQHVITGIAASFSGAAAGKLMTLKAGAAIIANFYVHNQFRHSFETPVVLADNEAAELSLAASGSAGVNGAVVLTGYSRPTAGWLLEVLDDTTVLLTQPVFEPFRLVFERPLKGTVGKQASARLSASGIAGIVGRVSLSGYSQ